MKALLVEDDVNTRLLLEEEIRLPGYDVTACENAETTLQAYHIIEI